MLKTTKKKDNVLVYFPWFWERHVLLEDLDFYLKEKHWYT